MKQDVYVWLSDYLSTEGSSPNVESIKTMLTKEHATAFLLVWPIFEQKLFDGFLSVPKIKRFASTHQRIGAQINMEEAVIHFHARYQNSRFYRNLRYRGKNMGVEKAPEITSFLARPVNTLTVEEKLYFLLYITYRFRNNLFHGNKGILSWCQFETEIDYCIQFMIQLIQAHKNTA